MQAGSAGGDQGPTPWHCLEQGVAIAPPVAAPRSPVQKARPWDLLPTARLATIEQIVKPLVRIVGAQGLFSEFGEGRLFSNISGIVGVPGS